MKMFLKIVGVLILIFVGYYFSPLNMASYTQRYKITVNVQTPDGVKSGSTVREVSQTYTKTHLYVISASSGPDIKGEAVVIDLGEKGKLFGLIKHGSYRELYWSFPYKADGEATWNGVKYYKSLKVGQKGRPLEYPSAWPDFVMFEDLSDPMSVKAVNKEDISKQLGAGYSVKNIEIEIVDKAPHCNILKQIPVFHEQYWVWRKTLEFNDPRKISAANFCKGVE